jgi:hypothetical protein
MNRKWSLKVRVSISVLLVGMVSRLTCQGEEAEVQLAFLSKRFRTAKERRKDEDVFGLERAIRFRLSNDSDTTYYYPAWHGGMVPFGNDLYRSLNSKHWECHPKCWEDAELDSLRNQEELVWLELPPKAAVEFEVRDSKRSLKEERAFLTVVRRGASKNLIRVTSNPYR